MTITVASYLKGIPEKNNNPQKPAIITGFIEGVLRCGDDGTVVTGYEPIDSDVAVVQGYVHQDSKNTPHLMLRKRVFEQQQRNNKRSIIVDSNLFLYADPNNSKGYLRYSYNGIFPCTGEYCNDTPDPNRWEKISKELGISLKPWTNHGRYVLICCQRNGGWSMNGQELMPWLFKLIKKIKSRSDRPIVVRFHPGDGHSPVHARKLAARRMPGVTISNADHIQQDLKNAHVVISYNSSPGVVAAIEGVHTIVLDPDHSQAAPVSTHHLNAIDNPPMYDREKWIQQMAQMHWNIKELKDGTAWKHLRKYAMK